MRIKYNAPTVLTFAFISAFVLLLSQILIHFDVYPDLTRDWFTVPGKGRFVPKDPSNWLRLFTHVAGHANWSHLISNFTFILLLGPILEESYGSLALFLMILITALVTGALNVLFFPSNLLGASGVVFMMIVLSSFTNFRAGEIPLTFILILVLYLGREIASSFDLTGLWGNHISEFAHIAGGFCGSLFGFFSTTKT